MSANVNKNLDLLCSRYGTPSIEYFPNINGRDKAWWRIWWHDWHVHHSVAMHGSCAYQGSTLEEVIMRVAEETRKHPPSRGEHCVKGCKHYSPCDY